MVSIIWESRAIESLDQIKNYIGKRSTKFAPITVNKIFEKVTLLQFFPLMGRIVPEISNANLRELIQGNYRIIYYLRNEFEITILFILHGAQRFPDLGDILDLD